ncbi:kinesin-like protein KIF6 isoform X3 [Girardinichthys multiradiatus]|nr:kinesin-like protein KIF6 isoform X3 [Girardinichthys multiradiatus]
MMYSTHISYLEIYNEVGYDLLDSRHEASRLEDLPKVVIMEDPEQNIHLKNLSLQQSTNEEEALNLLFLGDTNRMIAETPMNQASTRSHCVFTIHLCRREPGSATLRRSKLHLVDLAGSDRVSKTGLDGVLLTEAKYINLSLHYLEQVIIALSEKNRSHIPYRNSMLTSVLRDSLGGNCMTTMIATIAVDKRNLDESISTCRFAQRVALIKNEAVLNEELDPALFIARLKREIMSLREELAMVTGDQRDEQLTAEEIQRLDEVVNVFLNDPDPDVTLSLGPDMRKIQHCFFLLKSIILDKKRDKAVSSDRQQSPTGSKENSQPHNVSAAEVAKLNEMLKQRDNEISILVRILKKEKKRADDAVARLAYITNVKPLSSLRSFSISSASQPKEANMDTFLRNHGSTMLQLREGNVETVTPGYSKRMFTLPQFRVGKVDIFPTDCAGQLSTVLQFKEEHEKTFTEDHRGKIPTVPQLEEKNMDTFSLNQGEQVFKGPWFREKNQNIFGMDQEGQASTAVQLKVENMDTLLAEDKGVSIIPQFREGNMETVPERQGGRAVQYMKRGSKLSMGKQEAFEIFIRDHEEHRTIEENKNILKERSAEARRLGEQLNEARNRITELKKQLEMRRRQRAAHVVAENHAQDEEEFDPMEANLCKQIKQEKVTYKNTIDCLKALRTEIEHLQLLLERVKVKIQKDFQKWWSQEASKLQGSESGAEARYNAVSPNETLQPSSPGTPGFGAPDLSSTMESPSNWDKNPHSSVSSASDLSCLAPINKPPVPAWPAWNNKSQEGSKNPDFNSSSDWRALSTTTLPSSSIPLTGDQQVDADILAFVMARKNLLSRTGHPQT